MTFGVITNNLDSIGPTIYEGGLCVIIAKISTHSLLFKPHTWMIMIISIMFWTIIALI